MKRIVLLLIVAFALSSLQGLHGTAAEGAMLFEVSDLPDEVLTDQDYDLNVTLDPDITLGKVYVNSYVEHHTGAGYRLKGVQASTHILDITLSGTFAGLRIPLDASPSSGFTWSLTYGDDSYAGSVLSDQATEMYVQSSSIFIFFSDVLSMQAIPFDGFAELTLTFSSDAILIATSSSITTDSAGNAISVVPLEQDVHEIISVPSTYTFSLSFSKTGSQWVIAGYEDDVLGLFDPIASIQTTLVNAPSTYTISVQDTTGELGAAVELKTQVKQEGVAASGIVVTFFVEEPSYYLAGTATTSSSGIASLSYTHTKSVGSFALKARITVDGKMQAAQGILQIDPKPITLTQFALQAVYGVGNSTHPTKIVMSGKLTSHTQALAGADIVVTESSTNPTTIALRTNALGNFQYEWYSSKSIGLYSNALELVVTKDLHTTQVYAYDLNITKGSLLLSSPSSFVIDVDTEFILPLTFSNVNNLSFSVVIEEYQPADSSYLQVAALTYSSPVNVSLGTYSQVREYSFRITTGSTLEYDSTTFSVYLSVIQSQGVLTRVGLVDDSGQQVPLGTNDPTEFIEFKIFSAVDLDVFVQTDMGSLVESAEVRFELITSDSTVLLGTRTSTSTGLASFSWTPDISDLEDSLALIKVTATSASQFFDQIILHSIALPQELEVQRVDDNQPVYNQETTLTYRVLDEQGQGVAGLNISYELEGYSVFTLTNIYGEFSFSRTFLDVGVHHVQVSHQPQHNLPYNTLEQTLNITVQKAQYVISAEDISLHSGSKLKAEAQISSPSGSPVAGVTARIYEGSQLLAEVTSNSTGGVRYLSADPMIRELDAYTFKWEVAATTYFEETVSFFQVTVDRISVQLATNLTDFYYAFPARVAVSLSTIVPSITPADFNALSLEVSVVDVTLPQSILVNTEAQAFFTMPILLPGDYVFAVTLADTGVYAPTTLLVPFTVSGIDLELVWVEPPQDIVYGEAVNFSFRLQTVTAKPLTNTNVTIFLGDTKYVQRTDSEGLLVFSAQLEVDVNTTDIQILVTEHLGYERLSQTMQISIIKYQLDLQVHGTLTVEYTDTLPLWLQTTDEFGTNVSNVYVLVECYNQSAGEWQMLSSGYSDEVAMLQVLIDTTNLSVNQLLLLRISLHEQGHESFVTEAVKISVIAEATLMDVSHDVLIYRELDRIFYNFKDNDGQVIQGLQVVITDAYLNELGRGVTDANGSFALMMSVSTTGSFEVIVTTSHPLGYYTTTEHAHSFTIQQAHVQFEVTFVNINGEPGIKIFVLSNMSLQPELDVRLAKCTNYNQTSQQCEDDTPTWEYLGLQATVEGETVFVVDPQAVEYYRIYYTGSLGISAQYHYVEVSSTSATISVQDATVQYSDAFTPDVEVTGSLLLEFQIEVYYVNVSAPEGRTYWGTLTYSQGDVSRGLLVTMTPATYTLVFEILDQGWVSNQVSQAYLEVTAEMLMVQFDDLEVAIGQTYSFSYLIIDDDASLVNDMQLDLFITIDGTHQVLDSAQVINGSVTLHFTIADDMPVSNYTIRFVLSNTAVGNYVSTSSQQVLMAQYPSYIQTDDTPFSISYLYGATFSVTLYNGITNEPIPQENIYIRLVSLDGTHHQELYYVLTTNSFGEVTFEQIFAGMTPDDLSGWKLRVYHIRSDLYAYSSLHFVRGIDFVFIQDSLLIEYDISDFGPTQNQTLLVQLFDQHENVLADSILPSISATLYQVGNEEYSMGVTLDLTIINGSYYYRYVHSRSGEYLLQMELDNDLFVLVGPDTIDLGWPKLVVQTSLDGSANQIIPVAYGTDFLVFNVSAGDFVLQGIMISYEIYVEELEFNSITGTAYTDANGQVFIPLFRNGTNLPPLKYSLTVIIQSPEIIHTKVLDLQFRILQVDEDFSVSVDDVVYGTSLIVQINDTVLSGSYSISITLEGNLILEGYNLSSSALRTLVYEHSSSFAVGEYSYVITRSKPHHVEKVVEGEFTVLHIKAEIELDTSVQSDTITIHVTVRVNSLALDKVPYYLLTYGNSLNSTVGLFLNNATLVLPLMHNLQVNITLFAPYDGSYSQVVYQVDDPVTDPSGAGDEGVSQLDVALQWVQTPSILRDGIFLGSALLTLAVASTPMGKDAIRGLKRRVGLSSS